MAASVYVALTAKPSSSHQEQGDAPSRLPACALRIDSVSGNKGVVHLGTSGGGRVDGSVGQKPCYRVRSLAKPRSRQPVGSGPPHKRLDKL
jgi:hypothetical protein